MQDWHTYPKHSLLTVQLLYLEFRWPGYRQPLVRTDQKIRFFFSLIIKRVCIWYDILLPRAFFKFLILRFVYLFMAWSKLNCSVCHYGWKSKLPDKFNEHLCQIWCQIFIKSYLPIHGPGSSVGIATDYGLDGSGSNPGGDEIFRPSRPALGPTQPPVQWVLGLSRG